MDGSLYIFSAYPHAYPHITFVSQAPGETEAELAYLNQLGFIDGVMTDNSDALLIGARTVIQT